MRQEVPHRCGDYCTVTAVSCKRETASYITRGGERDIQMLTQVWPGFSETRIFVKLSSPTVDRRVDFHQSPVGLPFPVDLSDTLADEHASILAGEFNSPSRLVVTTSHFPSHRSEKTPGAPDGKRLAAKAAANYFEKIVSGPSLGELG